MYMTENKLVKGIGIGFTLWGIFLIITGDITNGLLSFIAGEIIDLPYRINHSRNKE